MEHPRDAEKAAVSGGDDDEVPPQYLEETARSPSVLAAGVAPTKECLRTPPTQFDDIRRRLKYVKVAIETTLASSSASAAQGLTRSNASASGTPESATWPRSTSQSLMAAVAEAAPRPASATSETMTEALPIALPRGAKRPVEAMGRGRDPGESLGGSACNGVTAAPTRFAAAAHDEVEGIASLRKYLRDEQAKEEAHLHELRRQRDALARQRTPGEQQQNQEKVSAAGIATVGAADRHRLGFATARPSSEAAVPKAGPDARRAPTLTAANALEHSAAHEAMLADLRNFSPEAFLRQLREEQANQQRLLAELKERKLRLHQARQEDLSSREKHSVRLLEAESAKILSGLRDSSRSSSAVAQAHAKLEQQSTLTSTSFASMGSSGMTSMGATPLRSAVRNTQAGRMDRSVDSALAATGTTTFGREGSRKWTGRDVAHRDTAQQSPSVIPPTPFSFRSGVEQPRRPAPAAPAVEQNGKANTNSFLASTSPLSRASALAATSPSPAVATPVRSVAAVAHSSLHGPWGVPRPPPRRHSPQLPNGMREEHRKVSFAGELPPASSSSNESYSRLAQHPLKFDAGPASSGAAQRGPRTLESRGGRVVPPTSSSPAPRQEPPNVLHDDRAQRGSCTELAVRHGTWSTPLPGAPGLRGGHERLYVSPSRQTPEGLVLDASEETAEESQPGMGFHRSYATANAMGAMPPEVSSASSRIGQRHSPPSRVASAQQRKEDWWRQPPAVHQRRHNGESLGSTSSTLSAERSDRTLPPPPRRADDADRHDSIKCRSERRRSDPVTDVPPRRFRVRGSPRPHQYGNTSSSGSMVSDDSGSTISSEGADVRHSAVRLLQEQGVPVRVRQGVYKAIPAKLAISSDFGELLLHVQKYERAPQAQVQVQAPLRRSASVPTAGPPAPGKRHQPMLSHVNIPAPHQGLTAMSPELLALRPRQFSSSLSSRQPLPVPLAPDMSSTNAAQQDGYVMHPIKHGDRVFFLPVPRVGGSHGPQPLPGPLLHHQPSPRRPQSPRPIPPLYSGAPRNNLAPSQVSAGAQGGLYMPSIRRNISLPPSSLKRATSPPRQSPSAPQIRLVRECHRFPLRDCYVLYPDGIFSFPYPKGHWGRGISRPRTVRRHSHLLPRKEYPESDCVCGVVCGTSAAALLRQFSCLLYAERQQFNPYRLFFINAVEESPRLSPREPRGAPKCETQLTARAVLQRRSGELQRQSTVNATLLVLQFRNRFDLAVFLLSATGSQRVPASHNGALLLARTGSPTASPTPRAEDGEHNADDVQPLTYGRVLWMIACQRVRHFLGGQSGVISRNIPHSRTLQYQTDRHRYESAQHEQTGRGSERRRKSHASSAHLLRSETMQFGREGAGAGFGLAPSVLFESSDSVSSSGPPTLPTVRENAMVSESELGRDHSRGLTPFKDGSEARGTQNRFGGYPDRRGGDRACSAGRRSPRGGGHHIHESRYTMHYDASPEMNTPVGSDFGTAGQRGWSCAERRNRHEGARSSPSSARHSRDPSMDRRATSVPSSVKWNGRDSPLLGTPRSDRADSLRGRPAANSAHKTSHHDNHEYSVSEEDDAPGSLADRNRNIAGAKKRSPIAEFFRTSRFAVPFFSISGGKENPKRKNRAFYGSPSEGRDADYESNNDLEAPWSGSKRFKAPPVRSK